MELLNYGYEFDSTLKQNGFLVGEHLTHLIIANVTFQYNMIFNNSSRALIYLTNFLEFSLKNCDFEYNFA